MRWMTVIVLRTAITQKTGAMRLKRAPRIASSLSLNFVYTKRVDSPEPRKKIRQHFELLSRLSWKWRKRSSVKITERTHEETTEALHVGRESRHSEEAFGGRSADLGSV